MAVLTGVNLAGNLIGAILAIHLIVAVALHLREGFVELVEKEQIQMLVQERRSKVETHTVAFSGGQSILAKTNTIEAAKKKGQDSLSSRRDV